MTGEDPTLREPTGHQIDVGTLLRDVVHLMCCIDTGVSLRHIWRRELRAKSDDGSWGLNDEIVGWLTPDYELDPERGRTMGVREACNKIIHAKAVSPQSVTEGDGGETIGALISLRGDWGGKPWAAEINLREFCIAVANADFFPHGTAGCQH